MKNRIALILGLLLILTACVSSKTSSELKEIDFVLDWTPNTNHIGIYVADKLGYFEDEGLKVNIIQPPEDGPEVLIGAGKGDIGVSFQDILAQLYGSDTPAPVTAIAGVLQHNTSGIISRKGEGMDRPKGMENKSYGSWNWDIELSTVKYVVESDGGDFSKVEIIPSTATDEVSALKSHLVDSIWVYYGWGGIACEQAGLETDYFSFRDIDKVFDYYTPVLIAGDEFLKENPEETKAFLRACEKGYKYAVENPEEAAKILVEADDALDEKMVYESIVYLSDYYMEDGVPWGHIDQSRWDGFFKWVYDNGLIENQLEPGHGMDCDYLP